jgi:hypothetical protein
MTPCLLFQAPDILINVSSDNMQPDINGILYVLWKHGEESMSHCLIQNVIWDVNVRVALVIKFFYGTGFQFFSVIQDT